MAGSSCRGSISALAALAALLTVAVPAGGETLYNGIVLPAPWPPQPAGVTHVYPDPQLPYYLQNPPSVCPVNVGRQLFVDDFLIQSTTLTRTHHLAEFYSGNPVLTPNALEGYGGGHPSAMPYSDGVWWDPNARQFKLFYFANYGSKTCMATSLDGIRWARPILGVWTDPNTNVCSIPTDTRDSAGIWPDWAASDPNQRWRIVYYRNGGVMHNAMSANGSQWYVTLPGDTGTGTAGCHVNCWDRTTLFYNPFRSKWVLNIRYHHSLAGRARKYWEMPDWTTKLTDANALPWWLTIDNQDLPDPRYGLATQLYNFDASPYESLMLGYFSVWHGDCHVVPTDPLYNDPEAVADRQNTRPKLNNIKLGYSRDGWYYHRPDRRPFLNYVETVEAYNWGNLQSALGGHLVMGDTLYIYFSTRNHQYDLIDDPNWPDEGPEPGEGEHTGMAFLRRDGFASMDAGFSTGELVTRKLTFTGSHLFVNVDCPEGELRVEVQDANGNAIAPYTLSNCRAVTADSTRYRVSWYGVEDLASLAGQQVRLRFQLTNGSLYAFWVSPSTDGRSNGYGGAGGPGLAAEAGQTMLRDTTGLAGYAAAYALNQVDAGPDRGVVISTPASLDGTVSNTGLPPGQSWTPTWTVTSGPGPVVFGNAGTVDTTATCSIAGRYVLRLTIDDGWMTAWDEMTVTATGVGGNDPPLAEAGSPQRITWPANTASLDGTVSDDGLPSPPAATTASWTKQSGSGTVSFASPTSVDTTATFCTTSTYVLRLTVNDGELSAYDQVMIVVTTNTPPTVSAGADQSISLPTNTVSLDGTVSDDGLPEGASVTQTWSVTGGAGIVTLGDAGAVDTTATFSTFGTYILRLTAYDTELTSWDEATITVNPQPNLPPTVNAGYDQIKAWPTNTVSLEALVTDDGLPPPPALTATWSSQSGPAAVTFGSIYAADTMATFSTTGTYVLRLTASDTDLTGYDELMVKLLPAGADLAMKLMMDEISGTVASDSSGNNHPATLRNGPTWVPGKIGNAVDFDELNDYGEIVDFTYGPELTLSFWFKLDDNAGTSQQFFFAHNNVGGAPSLNVYLNQANNPTTPNHLYTAVRDSTDNNPSTLNFLLTIDPNWHLYTLTVRPGEGCKVYLDGVLKTTDGSKGGDAINPPNNIMLGQRTGNGRFLGGCLDDVRLYVRALSDQEVAGLFLPGNAAPSVDAGPATLQVTWPASTASLDGTVSDDGLPSPPGVTTTTWTKQSGAGTVTFANAAAVDTTATFSTTGTCILRLTAGDSLLTAYDNVTVVVAPLNQAPVVNAGNDATITLPTDTYPLDGTVTDDGLPSPFGAFTVTWTKQSGPGTVNFIDANAQDTMVNVSMAGTYMLRLTASDSALTSHDEMNITVQSGNQPPSVNAGNDQSLTWPANTVSLDGTVSDDGLPNPPAATTATWSQTGGAGTVTFANASAPDTSATFSTGGTYTLRLTASDSDLSAFDEAAITVNPTGDLPADFNGDGAVTGADFVIWQAHYPIAFGAAKADGDANGDGGCDRYRLRHLAGLISAVAPPSQAVATPYGAFTLRRRSHFGPLQARERA